MKQQEGFISPMLQAKGCAIAFADFSTEQMATNAMHRLRGLQLGGNVEKGINVSYDKDDSEEKRKEKESRQLLNQAMSKCQQYNCRLCCLAQILYPC
jgi:gamma-glutamyl-gamma-aminobutyrate hydrolase PuuD